jgi:small-conductance mechanosensitive channel
MEFLEKVILGNEIASYLLAIGTLVGGVLLANIIRFVVLSRLKRWAQQTRTDLDDRLLRLIETPAIYLLYLGSFYISISNLSLHPILQDSLRVLCIILATLLVVQLTGSLVEYGVRVYWVANRKDATLENSLSALVPAIKVVVWAIGLIFLLDNLGFDITAVVASLGIGGVAVALAAQGVLADLFSYFSILFDRPFEIGDF